MYLTAYLMIFVNMKDYRINRLYRQYTIHTELQIKKNSCQTLGPASKRVLPDLLFFLRNFLIFHFQYSMIKGTILSLDTANDYYDQNQIKDIAKGG
jgi:hypothetical protein